MVQKIIPNARYFYLKHWVFIAIIGVELLIENELLEEITQPYT